jgi:hypothetical protein
MSETFEIYCTSRINPSFALACASFFLYYVNICPSI